MLLLPLAHYQVHPLTDYNQGRIQDFKLGGGGGGHFKKLHRADGGAKILGVFRVKNHDFTPKNHIFPILGGRACAPGSAPDNHKLYINDDAVDVDPPRLNRIQYIFERDE